MEESLVAILWECLEASKGCQYDRIDRKQKLQTKKVGCFSTWHHLANLKLEEFEASKQLQLKYRWQCAWRRPRWIYTVNSEWPNPDKFFLKTSQASGESSKSNQAHCCESSPGSNAHSCCKAFVLWTEMLSALTATLSKCVCVCVCACIYNVILVIITMITMMTMRMRMRMRWWWWWWWWWIYRYIYTYIQIYSRNQAIHPRSWQARWPWRCHILRPITAHDARRSNTCTITIDHNLSQTYIQYMYIYIIIYIYIHIHTHTHISCGILDSQKWGHMSKD